MTDKQPNLEPADNALTTTNQNPNLDATPLALIQAAIEHKADPSYLSQLMDLQERFEKNEAAKGFASALARFQQACPIITRKRAAAFKGVHAYNYASLDDIMRVISPILADCGLSVSFSAGATPTDPPMLTATCRIRCGIHVETAECTLPIPAEMRVNATQKMGAALSYAKRYALCAALNIVVSDEDNDAGGLGDTISEEQAITLGDMVEALPEDSQKAFSKWLTDSVGAPGLHSIPAKRYGEVHAALKRKLGSV